MATAKKAAGKKVNGKANAKSGAEVDDILGSKADDVLAGKKGAGKGKAAKAAAAAPKGKAAKAAAKTGGGRRAAGGGSTEEVRKILAATRKSTSYNDIAEQNKFDIRLVRRTARAMDEEGVLERVKEGTIVFVKAKRGGAAAA
jgi:hypothetical protein